MHERLRSWWAARQGLLATEAASPAAVLARTGWARSVGGVNPYLSLFARAGTSRAQAEQAAARREIHELPSARGCTYVVPREDFALALQVGQGFGSELQSAKKHLGVTDKEIDRLCGAVLGALADDEGRDPAALKVELGDAVRNLGEAGKKRGMTTTLPLALGLLQSRGQILRQPIGGRLDQQRYAYVRWRDAPRTDTLSAEEAQTLLARRYFAWIGAASAAHFQWFSGLGVKAAKSAIAALGLVPVAADSPLLASPADREALLGHRPPTEPVVRLLAGIDGLFLLRRDMSELLEPGDAARKVVGDRGAVELGGLQDLTSHAIVDRGRVIGLWEYDPEAGAIAWTSFVPATAGLRAEVLRVEAFVRDELGDARSFSLDSPEKRRPRIAALRAAG